MTTPTEFPAVEPIPISANLVAGRIARIDRAMVWLSDRLNPILVKETRQALKSKQFLITFTLLLICGWAWSLIGVAMIGPDVWRGAYGPTMFFGYYLILAVPLLVIVPFSAFRSLSEEQEDRTYELMSVTTLGPRQIVRGKLGSTVVQMLVYLSAISPCLAFTYMLRGIDFPTILYILFYSFLGSAALSVVGLLIGTLTSEKHWQVMMSVVLIGGLFMALWFGCMLTYIMLYEGGGGGLFRDAEFWQANAAFLTGITAYFVMIFYAAAAQISFASDNRSTRLRVMMVIQQMLFIGWMAWLWIWPARGEEEIFFIFTSFAAFHWFIMGAFMCGESPELSPRVKRDLPQSFLGRLFLTWFNPGPGTGYLFAISGMLSILVITGIGLVAAESLDLPGWRQFNRYGPEHFLSFGVLALSYVTIYLGLGLAVVRLLRKFAQVTLVAAVLLQVLLVLAGFGIPMIIHMMSRQLRSAGYSLLHITDPFWSSVHVTERGAFPAEGYILMTVVPLTALLVLFLNLPAVAREVRRVRIAKPQRVADEDATLAAKKHPVEPLRTSPWD